MSAVARAISGFAAEIARHSAALGRMVVVDERRVADRSEFLTLRPPRVWSPNGSCRMVRAADGWIAVNLPRESDRELVPAWLGAAPDADPWGATVRIARGRARRDLVADGRVLGLPVASVGEIAAMSPEATLRRLAAGGERRADEPLQVIDLSAMWAGPLCGDLLAQAGAAVTKVESASRPDAARLASPSFFERMNGRKRLDVVDFADPAQLRDLADAIVGADAVITGARPRAFEQLGLTPEILFARNPRLTWVAITGYGWVGEGADRVAFGDDAAAAGGLVRWSACGAPRFAGDALADPLTGLAAAAGALEAITLGGGFLVDAALARTAAGVVGRYGAASLAA